MRIVNKNYLIDHAKRLSNTELKIPGYAIALLIVLVIAFDLRIQSVRHTEVDTPVRADARQYFFYAYNLKNFGVYSSAETASPDTKLPVADAVRAPGYPLFILPFLSNPPTISDINSITTTQAYISTVAVLIVFLLARLILPVWLALTATTLAAISPHLITMNVYLLSETLFSFLLLSAIFLITRAIYDVSRHGKQERYTDKRNWLLLIGSALLAGAALTHPMLLYFLVPLIVFLFFFLGRKTALQKIVLVLLGFTLLFGPWAARNVISLGSMGDSTLMRASIRTGSYRDLMYQNNPQSYGYPYRFDPAFIDSYKSFPSLANALLQDFRGDPLAQLRWYIISKPIMSWSWVNAEGPGDVFVYPVMSSPYFFLPHFKVTHAFMHWTHWILVTLMVIGVVIAWLPLKFSGFSPSAAVAARMISLPLLYHLVVAIAAFPLPRYFIPMRPFMYIMAMIPITVILARFFPTQFKLEKAR